MSLPVVPLMPSPGDGEASRWYYQLPADGLRRHADRLAIMFSRHLFGTTPDRLAGHQARMVLALLRERFAA